MDGWIDRETRPECLSIADRSLCVHDGPTAIQSEWNLIRLWFFFFCCSSFVSFFRGFVDHLLKDRGFFVCWWWRLSALMNGKTSLHIMTVVFSPRSLCVNGVRSSENEQLSVMLAYYTTPVFDKPVVIDCQIDRSIDRCMVHWSAGS